MQAVLAIAVAPAIGLLGVGLGAAGAAENCSGYAALAVTQSKEHFALGSKNGLKEWWNATEFYHSSWCESLPSGSTLPGAGKNARAVALNECKVALRVRDDFTGRDEADPYLTEGGPVKAVA